MANFLTKVLESIFGKKYDKDVKAIRPFVDKTNDVYPKFANISNDELRGKTPEFRNRIAQHLSEIDQDVVGLRQTLADNPDISPEEKEEYYKAIEELGKVRDQKLEEVLLQILPEAFAVVKEAARRFKENTSLTATATELDYELAQKMPHIQIDGNTVTYQNTWAAAGVPIKWDMVHYEVQLIGGVALHQGKISEMATGEGKTLVATLPAYLNGLAGQGVHIVTVNDYLARRDSEWMGGLYNFLGLSVDCIDKHRPNSAERRKAYLADITYGTNNEFGFDYLRDNMVRNPSEMVQRKHHYAMVDEVDSVLIDDARTPLIIAGPADRGEEQEFEALKPRIESLVKIQEAAAQKFLNDARRMIAAGQKDEKTGGLALLRAHRALPKWKPLIKFLSETGIKKVLLDAESFYLQEQQRRMPEVDKELYFVIEEKNNSVELTDLGIETITKQGEDPTFFVLPDLGTRVAEIEHSDGTPEEKVSAKDRLMQDYAIKSERVHSIQQLLKAYTLFEKDVEYIVADNKVLIVDESTGRVLDGRRYSDGLHQAIEAKESVIIEAATQTYASITLQNYFRMYHKLAGMTGTAETEAGEFWQIYKLDVVVIPTNKAIVRDDREDLVYKTVREKYNAVVEEIERLVEAGRPVLVGTTSVENSEKLSRLLDRRKIPHNVLNAKQHAREAEIVVAAGQRGAVTIATNMAGRGTDIKLGPSVKEAGGLAIIGTERHESRRVDRQLRGRAGRQGDTGSSQFYVSLEDNLMRLFGSERMSSIMDRMGLQDGEVIQHSMITKSIERAQKKVEENHFGTRKRLLDYDEVMNAQRKVVYAKRRHALFGERLTLDLYTSFNDICNELVATFRQLQDYDNFKLEVVRFFAMETSISANDFAAQKPEKLSERLYEEAVKHYRHRCESLAASLLPEIARVAEEQPQYQLMRLDFTDFRRIISIVFSMKDALDSNGKTMIKELEKAVSLALIDDMWKEQLRRMDDLKQSVQSAVYEQKDPLLIYKRESFRIFEEMVGELNHDIASFMFRATRIEIQQQQAPRPAVRQKPQPQKPVLKTEHGNKQDSLGVDNFEVEEILEHEQQEQQEQPQAKQQKRPPLNVPQHPMPAKHDRNEKVSVKYMDGTVVKDVKYKKVENDLLAGKCRIINEK